MSDLATLEYFRQTGRSRRMLWGVLEEARNSSKPDTHILVIAFNYTTAKSLMLYFLDILQARGVSCTVNARAWEVNLPWAKVTFLPYTADPRRRIYTSVHFDHTVTNAVKEYYRQLFSTLRTGS